MYKIIKKYTDYVYIHIYKVSVLYTVSNICTVLWDVLINFNKIHKIKKVHFIKKLKINEIQYVSKPEIIIILINS